MLTLVLILLITWFVLAVLLGAGALWLQGYIYNDPATGLLWRAPAAALALALLVTFWCFLNYRAADPPPADLPYDTLFQFKSSEKTSEPVEQLWAVRPEGETSYRRQKTPPTYQYADERYQLWPKAKAKTIEAIIVLEKSPEGAKKTVFKADRDQGRYVEEGGRRYMTDDQLGRITTPGRGWPLANLALNLFHFVVWYLCLWLLLRFQWSHALGLAAAAWLLMTWLVIPQALANTPRLKAAAPAVASVLTTDYGLRTSSMPECA